MRAEALELQHTNNMIRNWSIVNNATSTVVSIILWDGQTEYSLPSNTTAYELDDSTSYVDVGYIRNPDGSYSPPPQDA